MQMYTERVRRQGSSSLLGCSNSLAVAKPAIRILDPVNKKSIYAANQVLLRTNIPKEAKATVRWKRPDERTNQGEQRRRSWQAVPKP